PWNKDHHKEQLRRVVTEIVESQAGKILGMTLNIWALDVKRVEIKIHALGVRELTEAIATWVDKELVAKHLGIKPELLTIEGGGGRPKEGLVDMTFKLYK
ncbi:MAG TPA: hypothetical protein VL522_13320, partial [Bordetella sp.]|nr:hypothetical protein [Bordetella sp.]